MIDPKLIKENPDFFKKTTKDKGYSIECIDKFLKFDSELREIIVKENALREERNKLAHEGSDKARAIEIKNKLKELKIVKEALEEETHKQLNLIPSPAFDTVPIGNSEDKNVVLKKHGSPKKMDFDPKTHVELGEKLGILNFADGSKVSGAKFYFLDNEGALLELALTQFALSVLSEKGFTPTITPDLAKSKFYLGTGYVPKGNEGQIYTIDEEDLGLIATSEITLAARHSDEIIDEARLPIKYAGVSHCFRKEAGAYGKYSKGLYRVHQFTKIEMFVYTTPEESKKAHEELLKIEESIWQQLEIPYRVLEMCTGDLGAIASRKFDIEAWLPSKNEYGEVTSTSNCTDFQSRNLNIRIKNKNGDIRYAHLLNGTAIAVSRAIIAILENNQNEDGSVDIPKVLHPYLNNIKKISPREV